MRLLYILTFKIKFLMKEMMYGTLHGKNVVKDNILHLCQKIRVIWKQVCAST